MIMSVYNIFVVLGTFPTDQESQQSFGNLLHYGIFEMVQDLSQNLRFVTMFQILFKITDKRIAGIHITLMASLTNQCSFIHKLYIFKLVDKFGIFYPQAAISVVALTVCWMMKDPI